MLYTFVNEAQENTGKYSETLASGQEHLPIHHVQIQSLLIGEMVFMLMICQYVDTLPFTLYREYGCDQGERGLEATFPFKPDP